jgi:hypothetical protein
LTPRAKHHGFVVTTFTPEFEKHTLPDGKDVTPDDVNSGERFIIKRMAQSEN